MDVKEFFDKQKWTFAKTYAKSAPHEYIVKNRHNGTEEEFVNAAKFINQNGINASFFSQPNTYLLLDGYMYWTKFNDAENAMIINRCKKDMYMFVLKRNFNYGDDLQGK